MKFQRKLTFLSAVCILLLCWKETDAVAVVKRTTEPISVPVSESSTAMATSAPTTSSSNSHQTSFSHRGEDDSPFASVFDMELESHPIDAFSSDDSSDSHESSSSDDSDGPRDNNEFDYDSDEDVYGTHPLAGHPSSGSLYNLDPPEIFNNEDYHTINAVLKTFLSEAYQYLQYVQRSKKTTPQLSGNPNEPSSSATFSSSSILSKTELKQKQSQLIRDIHQETLPTKLMYAIGQDMSSVVLNAEFLQNNLRNKPISAQLKEQECPIIVVDEELEENSEKNASGKGENIDSPFQNVAKAIVCRILVLHNIAFDLNLKKNKMAENTPVTDTFPFGGSILGEDSNVLNKFKQPRINIFESRSPTQVFYDSISSDAAYREKDRRIGELKNMVEKAMNVLRPFSHNSEKSENGKEKGKVKEPSLKHYMEQIRQAYSEMFYYDLKESPKNVMKQFAQDYKNLLNIIKELHDDTENTLKIAEKEYRLNSRNYYRLRVNPLKGAIPVNDNLLSAEIRNFKSAIPIGLNMEDIMKSFEHYQKFKADHAKVETESTMKELMIRRMSVALKTFFLISKDKKLVGKSLDFYKAQIQNERSSNDALPTTDKNEEGSQVSKNKNNVNEIQIENYSKMYQVTSAIKEFMGKHLLISVRGFPGIFSWRPLVDSMKYHFVQLINLPEIKTVLSS